MKFLNLKLLHLFCLLQITLLIFPEEVLLSLENVLNRIIKESTSLKLIKMEIKGSELLVKDAYSNIWPLVTGSAVYNRFYEEVAFSTEGQTVIVQPETSKTLGFHVEQPLFQYRVLGLAKAADHSLVSVLEKYNSHIDNAIYLVSHMYLNILSLETSLVILKESLKNVKLHLKTVKGRYEVGELPETSILQAEYEVEENELNILKLSNNRDNLKENLKIIIHFQENFSLMKPGFKVAPQLKTYSVAHWMQIAKEKRNDLKEIRSRIISFDFLKKSVKAEYYPSFKAFFNMDYNLDTTVFSPDKSTWVGGIKMDWIFFERGGRKVRIQKYDNVLKAEKLNLLLKEEEIQKNIFQNINEMKTILKNQKVHEKQIKLVDKYLQLRKEEFRVGLASNSEVLEANTFLVSAKLSENIDEYDLLLNYIGLLKETGQLDLLLRKT